MYDMIVLGATFAAAGISRSCKGSCLILEPKPYAGYEFVNALHFGSGYETPLKSPEARELYETFLKRRIFREDRICLFDCASPFYKLLEGREVLLGMQILRVEKQGDSFSCLVHGVSGYRTFEARRIVDTRCDSSMCRSKTYNMLIDGSGTVTLPADVKQEAWGLSHNYVLRCEVPLQTDYCEARKRATQVLKDLPEGHKLILLADVFDYAVNPGYPKEENGITYLPSKAYENPVLAFDAGVCFGAGGVLG